MANGKGRGWIKAGEYIVNFYLVGGLAASIIGGAYLIRTTDELAGFLVMILGVFITLLSVVSIKLLIGAADDLRYIRNHIKMKE